MMFRVRKAPLPEDALLQHYAQRPDCYTDCYRTTYPQTVAIEEFIGAFYRTPLFKSERLVLQVAFRSPSTDADLDAMASGKTDQFAAWTVEDRLPTQILLCDRSGRTRSWLMTRGHGGTSELFFGSAVVPKEPGGSLGTLFTVLLPFHKLYARALLRAARGALG